MNHSPFVLSENDIINLVDNVFVDIEELQRVNRHRQHQTTTKKISCRQSSTNNRKKRNHDQIYQSSATYCQLFNLGGAGVNNDDENNENIPQTYGFFVDIEMPFEKHARKAYNRADNIMVNDNESRDDLAFKAITAPKRNRDLENQADWAMVADIIDDVLSDCSFSSSNKSQNSLPI
jgi:hypothetical protein